MSNRFSSFKNFLTNHNKLHSFLLFFLISALFWLLMQLSKTYEYNFKVPVSYVNLPKQYYKGFLPNDTISVRMKLSGFRILHYKITKPVLKLDVQKSGLLQEKVWEVNKHLGKIRKLFGKSGIILLVKPSALELHIKAVHKKQVPVIPNVFVKFKSGFKNKEVAIIEPDSIWVYGQPEVLDTIKQVETNNYRFENIDNNIVKELNIKVLNDVRFNRASVSYHLKVSEIIEDTMSLPIQISGQPAKAKVLLFPKKIKLKFKIFKERYKTLKSGDFKIEVEYRPELKNWIPKLVKHPIDAFDFTIKPDKISYLIKQ